MGFEEQPARRALSAFGRDLAQAADYLINHGGQADGLGPVEREGGLSVDPLSREGRLLDSVRRMSREIPDREARRQAMGTLLSMIRNMLVSGRDGTEGWASAGSTRGRKRRGRENRQKPYDVHHSWRLMHLPPSCVLVYNRIILRRTNSAVCVSPTPSSSRRSGGTWQASTSSELLGSRRTSRVSSWCFVEMTRACCGWGGVRCKSTVTPLDSCVQVSTSDAEGAHTTCRTWCNRT